MTLEQYQTNNDWVLIDMIEIKPEKKGFKLFNPVKGKDQGTQTLYQTHPFQALVVKAPKSFSIGGILYDSAIMDGDVVILPGLPTINRGSQVRMPEIVNIEGKEYINIRYSEIRGFYTPTKEQRKDFVLMSDSSVPVESKMEETGKHIED